jgi:hypothetical protein
MTMAGALLAGAVEVAPPDTVGWHPHGMFDARGFAAMGCAEALVHAHDVADGLGVPWQASDELCDPVIDVLFPQALPRPPEVSGHDLLLWATGRLVPPGLPVVTNWSPAAGSGAPAAQAKLAASIRPVGPPPAITTSAPVAPSDWPVPEATVGVIARSFRCRAAARPPPPCGFPPGQGQARRPATCP